MTTIILGLICVLLLGIALGTLLMGWHINKKLNDKLNNK